jgi:hypothetical protein
MLCASGIYGTVGLVMRTTGNCPDMMNDTSKLYLNSDSASWEVHYFVCRNDSFITSTTDGDDDIYLYV